MPEGEKRERKREGGKEGGGRRGAGGLGVVSQSKEALFGLNIRWVDKTKQASLRAWMQCR